MPRLRKGPATSTAPSSRTSGIASHRLAMVRPIHSIGTKGRSVAYPTSAPRASAAVIVRPIATDRWNMASTCAVGTMAENPSATRSPAISDRLCSRSTIRSMTATCNAPARPAAHAIVHALHAGTRYEGTSERNVARGASGDGDSTARGQWAHADAFRPGNGGARPPRLHHARSRRRPPRRTRRPFDGGQRAPDARSRLRGRDPVFRRGPIVRARGALSPIVDRRAANGNRRDRGGLQMGLPIYGRLAGRRARPGGEGPRAFDAESPARGVGGDPGTAPAPLPDPFRRSGDPGPSERAGPRRAAAPARARPVCRSDGDRDEPGGDDPQGDGDPV